MLVLDLVPWDRPPLASASTSPGLARQASLTKPELPSPPFSSTVAGSFELGLPKSGGHILKRTPLFSQADSKTYSTKELRRLRRRILDTAKVLRKYLHHWPQSRKEYIGPLCEDQLTLWRGLAPEFDLFAWFKRIWTFPHSPICRCKCCLSLLCCKVVHHSCC